MFSEPIGEEKPVALYSRYAVHLISFFGGPIAILLLWMRVSQLRGRIRKDLWIFFAGATLFAAMSVASIAWIFHLGNPVENANALSNEPLIKFAPKVLGVLIGVAFVRVHAENYRMMEIMGLKPRSPRKIAAGGFLAGTALTGALFAGLLAIFL